METMRTATLFAIFMKCLVASTGVVAGIRDVVNGRDVETTVEMCKQNEKWRQEGLEQAVLNDDHEFVIEVVKRAELVDADTLVILYGRGSGAMIERVVEAVPFEPRHFISAAFSKILVYCQDALIMLLGKIDKGYHDTIINTRMRNLLSHGRDDLIEPHLCALRDNGLLDERDEAYAIQNIFVGELELKAKQWR